LEAQSHYVALATDVFRSLNLSAAVLVEAPAKVVAERLKARDGVDRDLQWLDDFMDKERGVAATVCQELDLSLYLAISPSDAEFEKAVAAGLPK